MNTNTPIICSIFIALDIISGFISAIKNKEYQSSIMREGLFHKSGEILAVVFAYFVEFSLPIIGISTNLPIAQSIMVYIIVMETGSIIENIGKLSPELRGVLTKYISSNLPREEKEVKGKHERNEEGNRVDKTDSE